MRVGVACLIMGVRETSVVVADPATIHIVRGLGEPPMGVVPRVVGVVYG